MADSSLQYLAEDDTLEDPIDISSHTINNPEADESPNDRDNILTDDLTSPRSHNSQATYQRQQHDSYPQQSSYGSDELHTINAHPSESGRDCIDLEEDVFNDEKQDQNENNVSNRRLSKANFSLSSGSDNSDTPHSTKVRKLTDALNPAHIESTRKALEPTPKLKTQFKLKRDTSPSNTISSYSQGPEISTLSGNAKLSHPFPLQRATSDINNETLRLPQVVSVSKLNHSLQTSTPTVSHVTSKEDMSNGNNENLTLKKSSHNITNNNSTDDSAGDSNLNLKIKKNQTVVKLPSESQIINNSLQTPRPKNTPSMNKTDYFAAKLADATNEKTNKQDDQEENFVYEDLMLDQDKQPAKKMSTKINHQNEDKDEDKAKGLQEAEKSIAKQSSKASNKSENHHNSTSNSTSSSVVNNISQNSNAIPSGKNLTNQPSVIIDPSRLMLSNQKSSSVISQHNLSDNARVSDKSMSNEINNNTTIQSLDPPAVFTTNTVEDATGMKFLNVENVLSNLSSLSNRPSNLMNNRNNLTSAVSQNLVNVQKQELENNLENFQPHVLSRPSLVTLSTTSSNNNLSQYKKMMQNNARHSSVTVGVLPNRQHNKGILLQQDKFDQTAVSPNLNQDNFSNNNTNSSGFYNDMLDYSSPNKKNGLKSIRDKSNRSSMIEEIQEDQGDFVIPTASSFVFESGKNDNLKKSTLLHDTLEETELNKKINTNNIPELPFDNNKQKTRQSSALGSPTDHYSYNTKTSRASFSKPIERKSTTSSLNRFITKGTDDIIDNDDIDNGPFSSNFNNHLKNIMSETQSEWDDVSNKNHNQKLSLPTAAQTNLDASLHNKNQNTNPQGNDIFKSPQVKLYSGYDNISSHHHFGLDDDYDEDDFDERSSFYYHPRKNSQSNIGRGSTFTSNSNIPRKMRSQKGLSYSKSSNNPGTHSNDNYLYDTSFNGSRLYDEETEQNLRNHFSSANLNKHKEKDMDGSENVNNLTDEENNNYNEETDPKFYKHSRKTSKTVKKDGSRKASRQYLWGDNELLFDDENSYPPLTSENNRNVYYYDSIHDFSPAKDNSSGSNGKKMNIVPHFGNHYYSPHDYYNKNTFHPDGSKVKKTLWSKIKLFICWILLITCLIMVGVGIGAFLVSNKELEEFGIADMFNSIIAQDEIIFDITAFAHNPSLLSISMQTVNIDIFAESQYLENGDDSSFSISGKPDDTVTILLGSVFDLETPFVFKSNFFFFRHLSLSTSTIKLKNPGKTANKDDFILGMNYELGDLSSLDSGFTEKGLPTLSNQPTSRRTTITLKPSDENSSKEVPTSTSKTIITSTKTETSHVTFSDSTTASSITLTGTETATKTTTTTLGITSTTSSFSSHTPPVPPPRKDKKFRQWQDISKYEFTLIIKGAAYYEVPFIKSQRSVPIQHQVIMNKGKHKPND